MKYRWREPVDFSDYLDYQIEKTTAEIENKKMEITKNLDYLNGQSITIFCAARDSRIEELTALYAELKRLYETKHAYEYYQNKEDKQ